MDFIGTGGAAANIGAYTSTGPEERSLTDLYSELDAAKQARRHAACDAVTAVLPQLEQRLATLGVELRYDAASGLVHTYELWRGGKRWGWWWPSRGRTRFGNAAGPDCPTAEHLIAHIEQVAPTLPPVRSKALKPGMLGHLAFAEWLAERLPADMLPRVWQPKDRTFTRVYVRGTEYVHVARSSVRCSCAIIKALVDAAMQQHRVEATRSGFIVRASV